MRQSSLGAFVLHVYGLLMVAQLQLPYDLWINTLVQVTLVITIATLLNGAESFRVRRRHAAPAHVQPVAA